MEAFTDKEKIIVEKYIKSLNTNKFTDLKLLLQKHATQIRRVIEESLIDTKEYQKSMIGTTAEDNQLIVANPYAISKDELTILEVNVKTMLSIASAYELARELSIPGRLKYSYLHLDSNNVYEFNEDRTKFKWLINEEKPQLVQGYINLYTNIRNIRMARLGRMYFTHLHDSMADLFQTKARIAFGFDEFASQALITPNGTKFQFIEFFQDFDQRYGTNMVLTAFNANRGWFRFRERFKRIDTLTLNIYNLLTSSRISLPDVKYSFVATQEIFNTGTPNEGRIGNITVPDAFNQLPIRPNLDTVTGLPSTVFTGTQMLDTVELSGFTTDDPIADAALIAAYNTAGQRIQGATIQNMLIVPGMILSTGTFFVTPTSVPVTVTLSFKPRFNGVLELLCDDEDDDPPI